MVNSEAYDMAYNAFAEANGPLSLTELSGILSGRLGTVNPITVYDIVSLLEATGDINRVEESGYDRDRKYNLNWS